MPYGPKITAFPAAIRALTPRTLLRAGGDQADRAPVRLFSRTVEKGNPLRHLVPFSSHATDHGISSLLASCAQTSRKHARPSSGNMRPKRPPTKSI
jgi:hypothetical protein